MVTDVKFKNLLVERHGAAATIVINRPEVLNALNHETMEELMVAFDGEDRDPAVRGVIVTGSGEKSFVSGADINELKNLSPIQGLDKTRHGQALLRRLEAMRKPTIAAVNGFALGGGLELALACDIRLAAPKARLGLPEVKLGVLPGFGGTQRLPRLIGRGAALELICTGDIIDAAEALRIGLVNKVVDMEQLLPTARAMVDRIAANGPLAVAAARRAVLDGVNLDLERGMELEALHFATICGTQDKLEGTSAFLEKRKAQFKGD
ncbi:MAG TPA: enoyl-CoA hydratase-related protein [Candidatus Xenobia bacterium]